MVINFHPTSVDIYISIIVKPYYLANTEFLHYALHNVKQNLQNRTVNLWAMRGTPISIPPYSGVVDLIVDQLNLPADKIFVHTRDPDFFNPKVTKVEYNLWDETFKNKILGPYLKDLKSLTPDNPKRFGALFGRMQLGRLLLAHHLETVWAEHSIVSFLADKISLEDQISGLNNFFESIKSWWDARENLKIFQTPDTKFGVFDHPNNIITYPEVEKLFQLEIVVETDYRSIADYTEKTWRCLAIGKPFLMLNGSGSLKHLQSLGFKTFAPWINESYDSITDFIERIEAIKKEIDRLATMDQAQWQYTYNQIKLIADQNAKFYQSCNL